MPRFTKEKDVINVETGEVVQETIEISNFRKAEDAKDDPYVRLHTNRIVTLLKANKIKRGALDVLLGLLDTAYRPGGILVLNVSVKRAIANSCGFKKYRTVDNILIQLKKLNIILPCKDPTDPSKVLVSTFMLNNFYFSKGSMTEVEQIRKLLVQQKLINPQDPSFDKYSQKLHKEGIRKDLIPNEVQEMVVGRDRQIEMDKDLSKMSKKELIKVIEEMRYGNSKSPEKNIIAQIEEPISPKRKRGRPRKEPSEKSMSEVPKRGRGRPKGSKNKPKPNYVQAPTVEMFDLIQ